MVVRQFQLDLNRDFDAITTITRFCFSEGPSISTTVDLPGFIQEVVFAATTYDQTKPLRHGEQPKRKPGEEILTPVSQVIVSCSLQKYANILYDAGSKGTHSQL